MSTSHKPESICPGPSSPADNRQRRQFKGVRMRKWGKWVSEVRIPNCKGKIWLGSYETAEQAARAFDAATYCLRGPRAKFNFPNSIPAIPSASSLSRQQIQQAAANYALAQIPAAENSSNLAEKPATPPPPPSRLSLNPEAGAPSDAIQLVSEEELDSAMWDSIFAESDCNQSFDVKKFPFLEPSTSPREEQEQGLCDI
ncbi:hypothetical protein SUGI_0127240 [Cryptomeria japonica]|uniref:ethylene-responsive transcription factor ERF018 n=1 Tax=Cryptomeria japonica TaxID=3369 RepID=UPI002408D174|nr:ethylene-responsive transcription factor ERF018 [Cryptomeria japonica]GLJ10385.1 hypothetical protein SUGI_0127240 [Cryptomeria japonica]